MTDIEISQKANLLPIEDIAQKLGISKHDFYAYGKGKAKINHRLASDKKHGKIILVTAISPTPAGEGKTTTTIGLGDSLASLGKKTVICLREPSMGPVFGMKGGATGGGYAQVVPMEDINLHFTGDFHAISAANNLLAAMIDNHIYQGNALNIDPRRILWKRAIDMNDRQLRFIVNGLGGKAHGTPREDGFNITAASEVMAVFCLSENLEELKSNLGKIVAAYNFAGKPVTVAEIGASGAMTSILKDAFDPNLVQTLEHTPAIIHGGPFANIAHGCNTLVATKLAARLGDYVVTEAGFGADLGAEKFLNIKCRKMGIFPDAAVLVATVRALKFHGGCDKLELNKENSEALKTGIENLKRHIDNMTNVYGLPCVVALNRFPTDTDAELEYVKQEVINMGAKYALSTVFSHGSKGGEELANAVLESIDKPKNIQHTYELNQKLTNKIKTIATKVYRAKSVVFSAEASTMIRNLEKQGFGNLPICMAKTQYSFTDDPKKIGAATDFDIHIREVRLMAGAGFVVAITGDIMTMPGLPKIPAANEIDIDNEGRISGLS